MYQVGAFGRGKLSRTPSQADCNSKYTPCWSPGQRLPTRPDFAPPPVEQPGWGRKGTEAVLSCNWRPKRRNPLSKCAPLDHDTLDRVISRWHFRIRCRGPEWIPVHGLMPRCKGSVSQGESVHATRGQGSEVPRYPGTKSPVVYEPAMPFLTSSPDLSSLAI